MKENHAIIDISEAPDHIRKEIESLGTTGIHDAASLDRLSRETKAWIMEHAKAGIDKSKALHELYASMVRDIHNAVLGLQVLEQVVGEEDARAMNIEVYNACAEFCREYNAKEILGDG